MAWRRTGTDFGRRAGFYHAAAPGATRLWRRGGLSGRMAGMDTETHAFLAAALVAVGAAAARAQAADDLFSQHLDVERAGCVYAGALLPDTAFGDHGETDLVELSLDWRWIVSDGFLWGTLGLDAAARLTYFVDDPGLDALPDALLAAWLEPAYTLRFTNGWSIRAAARPGLYSDATHPAFSCPVALDFYFAYSPELSFVVGGEWRPGWDFAFLPHAGLVWEPGEALRVELACPSSRIELFPRHVLTVFAAGQWLNTTYALDAGGSDGWKPDDVTFDELRVSAGVSLRLFDTWVLAGEAGTWLERELSADVRGEHAMDLSKDDFFRLTLSGAF